MLWKIQKFDWLISVLKSVPFLHECHFGSAWMSFWPAMPELLPGETRIHSSRVEPEKHYWFQINKNLPLFDRAICSNNSMLWRTASLFTAVIQVTTRVTCDAWRVHINNDNMETVLGEVQRLSKHEISGAFSGRIHLRIEYSYNTYIFWPLFNVNCSVLRPQIVCKRSLPGYTPDFQDTMR